MELLQLNYFCNAAKCENFSKTAATFGVPPSDISQSIKRLEKELGTELFLRRANSISLNEKGRAFYEKVREALSIIDGAKAELTDDEQKGTLSVCINTNRRIVMQTIESFRRKYPEVDIYTKNGADYFSEKFDLVIDNSYPDSDSYERIKLLTEGISLAVKRDDPLAQKDTIDIDELRSRPFITMPETQSLYKLTIDICSSIGFTPRIAIMSDDPYYVRKCVELGLGVTFVPDISWKGQIPSSIRLIGLKGYTRDTFVFYDRGNYMNKAAENFKEMLIEQFGKEME